MPDVAALPGVLSSGPSQASKQARAAVLGRLWGAFGREPIFQRLHRGDAKVLVTTDGANGDSAADAAAD